MDITWRRPAAPVASTRPGLSHGGGAGPGRGTAPRV